jgi:hypothetical protein
LPLEELYDKVAHLIKVNNIDRVIATETIRFKDKFTNALLQKHSRVYRCNITIDFIMKPFLIIKGARTFQFEEK